MEHLDNDMSTLPNTQVKEALTEIIRNNVDTHKYVLKIQSGSSKGDNYIGVVYRAIVEYNEEIENTGSKKEKIKSETEDKTSFSVIIKVPPQNPIRRKQFFARPCFLREALVYDEILPMFMDFQKSKNINKEDTFYEISKCYKTLTEDYYEAIFLKDLRCDGFEMFSRLENVSIDYALIVIKILAKFHAISFAIKDQCPEKMEKFTKLPDIFEDRREDVGLRFYFEELKGRAFDTLKSETDKEYQDKLNSVFENTTFFDLMMNLAKGSDAEPYAVICHGDCWNNNILFKKKSGIPVEARLIDWQITRFSSPVCDLAYYIFTSTSKALRNKHYEEMLSVYHSELSKYLEMLGSDPNKLFPRSALNEQLTKFGKFGLVMAIMLLPLFISQVDDIPDLDEVSGQLSSGEDIKSHMKSERSLELYQQKMRDVIIDMANLGYI